MSWFWGHMQGKDLFQGILSLLLLQNRHCLSNICFNSSAADVTPDSACDWTEQSPSSFALAGTLTYWSVNLQVVTNKRCLKAHLALTTISWLWGNSLKSWLPHAFKEGSCAFKKRTKQAHTSPKQQKPPSIYNLQALQGSVQAAMMSVALSASLSHASEAEAPHSRALCSRLSLHRAALGSRGCCCSSSAGELCLCTASGLLDAQLLLLPCLTLLGFLKSLPGRAGGGLVNTASMWEEK